MTELPPQLERIIVGCMTGTSIDAIDAAVVRVEGRGLEARAECVATISRPLGPIARDLRALASGRPARARDVARLAWRLGEIHTRTILELLTESHAAIDLVAVHGQTVFHRPPLSWQLLNPAPIARALRVPVVFNLRQADLAAGGQGAPITPVADWILLRSLRRSWALANLGGFCNITILEDPRSDAETLRGFDLCACNQLLDSIARERLNIPYDKGGAAASHGWVHEKHRDDLIDLLREQHAQGRSLGSGDELEGWIDRMDFLSPEDVCATACAAIATVIADACRPASLFLLAGGGTKNQFLVGCINAEASRRRVDVRLTDEFGVPAQHREAVAMAILGALCEDRVPITLPTTTGRADNAPIAGHWVIP